MSYSFSAFHGNLIQLAAGKRLTFSLLPLAACGQNRGWTVMPHRHTNHFVCRAGVAHNPVAEGEGAGKGKQKNGVHLMLAIHSGKCSFGQFSRIETRNGFARQMARKPPLPSPPPKGWMSPERARRGRGKKGKRAGRVTWSSAWGHRSGNQQGDPLSGMPTSQSQPPFGDGPVKMLTLFDTLSTTGRLLC